MFDFIVTGFLGGIFLAIQRWPILRPHSKSKKIFPTQEDNDRQDLDLYLPKKPASNQLPLLVYILGGGWEGGSKNDSCFATASCVTNGN